MPGALNGTAGMAMALLCHRQKTGEYKLSLLWNMVVYSFMIKTTDKGTSSKAQQNHCVLH